MRSAHRRAAITIVTAVAFLLAPLAIGVAFADPTDQARQHFKKGRELYDAGDYRGAIAEFAAADQTAPSPLLEYNIALCHERLGEKAEAARRYRAYLDRTPDAQNRAAVEEKIRKLEAAAPPATGDLPPLPPDDPPAGPDPADPPSGEPPTAAGPVAPSGDPELDRVAGIDVGRVHAERRGGAPTGPPPAAGMTAGGSASASAGGPPPAAPAPEQPKSESKPIYKQWWFWVVAGVSAIILIDIATSGDDGSSSDLLFPAPGIGDRGPAPSSGGVMLRF
ncbi:MAG TPA: hypothetical protein VMZ28_01040 [Kofleriaceae bacterium]|nr:hypothetical protein [Kofleriaceae bacterium]